jgi:hypothetical protein
MKNLSFTFKSITLSMLLLVAFTACQKEEQSNQIDSQPQVPIAKTHEAKVMQQTSNVIVNMLAENPELFNNINEIIKSDAVEYMEDRILFADLFKNRTPLRRPCRHVGSPCSPCWNQSFDSKKIA